MFHVVFVMKVFKMVKYTRWLGTCTHMEISGCNNLVSYKVATRLKMLWICNIFYLVVTLINGCIQTLGSNLKIINVFMYRSYGFYTQEVDDTHTWVLQFVNPIVKALY